jgi:hypothetical protein
MTDRDLKKHLERVTPPAVNEAARDRALYRATVALSQPADSAPSDERHSVWRASYGWVAVFAVMLVAGLVMIRPSQPAAVANGGADLQTLAQVEGLFPGQLNAVIESDGEVQLDLAGSSSPTATDQPVLVQLEGGGHRLRVLSYSGRSVTIELKGTRFTFEALVTSDGGVVLVGDDFAWSSAQSKPLAGYRIHARSLTAL